MAVVTRFFSTTSAGAGDGTSWANRAALFSSGNWSSVITGFNFSGSDSLEARVGPGNYTSNQTLASGLFSNPPTVLNPLIVRACDSSGNNWSPPNLGWVSAQPTWDQTGMPVITCGNTITVRSVDIANAVLIGISWRPGSGGHFATLFNSGSFFWNYIHINVGGNQGIGGGSCNFWNCSALITGNIGSASGGGGIEGNLVNCRCETNNASNTCPGMVVQNGSMTNCSSIGWANSFRQANSFNSWVITLSNCLGVTRSAAGTEGLRHSTASATARSRMIKTLIVDAVTGVMSSASANTEIVDSVFNNVATPIGYSTNMLTDFTTSSESLANLFVDTAGGDYRIKRTSSLWGKGIGAGDELVSGSVRVPNIRGGADQ